MGNCINLTKYIDNNLEQDWIDAWCRDLQWRINCEGCKDCNWRRYGKHLMMTTFKSKFCYECKRYKHRTRENRDEVGYGRVYQCSVCNRWFSGVTDSD